MQQDSTPLAGLSIDRLRLASGDRALIVRAGTGLDLDFLPSNVHVTAIDVTPAMLKHLERRAAGMGRPVTARIMDARQLAFPDSSLDAVVMHLILAVMPEQERGFAEAVGVLKPGVGGKPLNTNGIELDVHMVTDVCDNRCVTARKLSILKTERCWSGPIRHAWKAKRASNTEPLRSVLTDTRSAG